MYVWDYLHFYGSNITTSGVKSRIWTFQRLFNDKATSDVRLSINTSLFRHIFVHMQQQHIPYYNQQLCEATDDFTSASFFWETK